MPEVIKNCLVVPLWLISNFRFWVEIFRGEEAFEPLAIAALVYGQTERHGELVAKFFGIFDHLIESVEKLNAEFIYGPINLFFHLFGFDLNERADEIIIICLALLYLFLLYQHRVKVAIRRVEELESDVWNKRVGYYTRWAGMIFLPFPFDMWVGGSGTQKDELLKAKEDAKNARNGLDALKDSFFKVIVFELAVNIILLVICIVWLFF